MTSNNNTSSPTSGRNVDSSHSVSLPSNSSGTTPFQATPFQIGLGLMILGASAGMTLYTKKTQAFLNQMKRVQQNVETRNPKKFGPPTKEEYEKMKPRINDDDL